MSDFGSSQRYPSNTDDRLCCAVTPAPTDNMNKGRNIIAARRAWDASARSSARAVSASEKRTVAHARTKEEIATVTAENAHSLLPSLSMENRQQMTKYPSEREKTFTAWSKPNTIGRSRPHETFNSSIVAGIPIKSTPAEVQKQAIRTAFRSSNWITLPAA